MPRRAPVYAPLPPAPPPAGDVLTLREAAALAKVGRTKLWELMDAGVLPWAKPGKCRVVPRRALVAWLESQLRVK